MAISGSPKIWPEKYGTNVAPFQDPGDLPLNNNHFPRKSEVQGSPGA